jgi:hypothetical protein
VCQPNTGRRKGLNAFGEAADGTQYATKQAAHETAHLANEAGHSTKNVAGIDVHAGANARGRPSADGKATSHGIYFVSAQFTHAFVWTHVFLLCLRFL